MPINVSTHKMRQLSKKVKEKKQLLPLGFTGQERPMVKVPTLKPHQHNAKKRRREITITEQTLHVQPWHEDDVFRAHTPLT